ncbi:TolC family protein [Paludibacter sp. 221]|uniref:TolC family protein n=1 Tax=Paludibacter sp. 221 TaxID=2302939 RepID=UPI0013D70394|nr:TolC family protein [Paludibacter sp. 221]
MKQFKIKQVFLVVLLSGLSVFAVQAQTQEEAQVPDTLVVSLSEALDIALSESPTIKVADKEIERVRYAKRETTSGFWPTVSLSGAYQRALKKQRMMFDIPGMPSNPDGIEVGQDNTFTGGLSASLPLIAPQLWSAVNLSEQQLELSIETSRASKIDLVNQVSKAYYGILMAQDSYNVIKRSYDNSVENAQIVKNKFEQGTVSEFEWIRADVQARSALTNVVSAESGVTLATLQLKMLMGINMYTEIKVVGKLSDFESTMYGDVMAIDTTTLQNNTDLKQFDLQTKQLEQSLKINKSSALPTLGLNFDYNIMSMVNDEQTFTEDHIWFGVSNLSVGLSIPLFQGGAKHQKNKQIKVQLDQMELNRLNLERGLQLQVINYMENIKKSLKKIESDKQAMNQAEKAMQISQKMYEVGMATYLDVSNSELAYINAGLSYNQSIYEYLSNKADLEKILGDSYNNN